MRNILIVDPHPDDYAELVTASAELNTVFHFATTAEEALRVAQAVRPAVWLVNLLLPDMPGHELLSEVKLRRPQERVWLVANSYNAADELCARAAGTPVFVCKPIRGSQLTGTSATTPSLRPQVRRFLPSLLQATNGSQQLEAPQEASRN